MGHRNGNWSHRKQAYTIIFERGKKIEERSVDVQRFIKEREINTESNIQFGEGYYEMTQRYNGTWYSICALDWGQQMQSLASTVTTQRVFDIEESDPVENTITVGSNSSTFSIETIFCSSHE